MTRDEIRQSRFRQCCPGLVRINDYITHERDYSIRGAPQSHREDVLNVVESNSIQLQCTTFFLDFPKDDHKFEVNNDTVDLVRRREKEMVAGEGWQALVMLLNHLQFNLH